MVGTVVLVALKHLDIPSLQRLLSTQQLAGEVTHAQAHQVGEHVVLHAAMPFSESTIKRMHSLTGREIIQISAGAQREVGLWQVYSDRQDRILITMDGEVQISEGTPHTAEVEDLNQLNACALYRMLSRALGVELSSATFSNADEGTPMVLPV
jgi:hypothetical protein